MLVHIVFAHPSHDSFTGALLDAFTDGLDDAGHEHTVSDLYQMGFSPILDIDSYRREAAYAADLPVPGDVAAEQAKLDAADVWVFVYPVWWTDCPAILKGWFDRVWSVGYAYEPGHTDAGRGQRELALAAEAKEGVDERSEEHTHPERALPGVAASMDTARWALVLCAAGHTEAELRESGCLQAMETVMLTDRISTRAEHKQFIVFGGSAVLKAETWQQQRVEHLAAARALGRGLH